MRDRASKLLKIIYDWKILAKVVAVIVCSSLSLCRRCVESKRAVRTELYTFMWCQLMIMKSTVHNSKSFKPIYSKFLSPHQHLTQLKLLADARQMSRAVISDELYVIMLIQHQILWRCVCVTNDRKCYSPVFYSVDPLWAECNPRLYCDYKQCMFVVDWQFDLILIKTKRFDCRWFLIVCAVFCLMFIRVLLRVRGTCKCPKHCRIELKYTLIMLRFWIGINSPVAQDKKNWEYSRVHDCMFRRMEELYPCQLFIHPMIADFGRTRFTHCEGDEKKKSNTRREL